VGYDPFMDSNWLKSCKMPDFPTCRFCNIGKEGSFSSLMVACLSIRIRALENWFIPNLEEFIEAVS
jgi:hypothetical protein